MVNIRKIKEENRFYLPNFSLLFQEHLDIFSVFHTKERVNFFIKKLVVNAKKFYEENRDKDLPCPIQNNNSNPYVLGVDYGFFLKNLIDFLIEEGGIIEEKEKEKVKRLVYLFYGISFKNYKMNYSAQILMKNLFGLIYGVTSYKNFELKGNIFYPFFVEKIDGTIYKLNLIFIKKTAIEKAFLDEKNSFLLFDFFENVSDKFIKNPLPNSISKELFKVEKIL